jgi:hypothetical protein
MGPEGCFSCGAALLCVHLKAELHPVGARDVAVACVDFFGCQRRSVGGAQSLTE